METDVSAPRFHKPTTRPYTKPDQSNPCHHPISFKICCHFIYQHMPRVSKLSLPFRFMHQKLLSTYSVLRVCATCSAHLSILDLLFCVEYKSWSFFPWNFYQSPFAFSLLVSNIVLKIPTGMCVLFSVKSSGDCTILTIILIFVVYFSLGCDLLSFVRPKPAPYITSV